MAETSALKTALTDIFRQTPGNIIAEEAALEGCGGLMLFEEPVFGFADAEDALFEEFRKPEIIGDPYLSPKEWLPAAETVISFFLPFTEAVRRSNRGTPDETSGGWLHGRIEGQAFIEGYLKNLGAYFKDRDKEVCIPYFDERFRVQRDDSGEDIRFSCAWSERHAAFAAGLGTFSLTRGLITERGVAGRFGSLIVSEKYEPSERPYIYSHEYCIRCGACIARCPAGAISLEYGKNQTLCREWVEDRTAKAYYPRYGCGKCQTDVPCECERP